MTPWSYSLSLATTPAIVVYLWAALRELLGQKGGIAPSRLVRVEFAEDDTAGRVHGCFDAALLRR